MIKRGLAAHEEDMIEALLLDLAATG